ncbi:hypothetical protein AVEN_265121-1 [Araneus ventricosus]|uniref:Uncharacterized protein n=1 Tax=Araneus ventricosus TaxID=182803 RepID=A0A4Y2NJV7_ARAVE|nr:hypothetical protein AVEN_265121-1 [Araneus ventricosus]
MLIEESTDEVNLNYIKDLLVHFVNMFGEIYGIKDLSYNIHGLIHLPYDVKTYSKMDNFNLFKFENFMQKLKHDYEEGKKLKKSLKSSDLEVSTDFEQRRPKKRTTDCCESSNLYDFPETPSKRAVSQPQTSTPTTSNRDVNEELNQILTYMQMQLDMLLDNQKRILENQRLILEGNENKRQRNRRI